MEYKRNINNCMRIGILTHPLCHNFGGVLQAYALYTYLSARGHDLYIIQQFRPSLKDIIKKIITPFFKILHIDYAFVVDYVQNEHFRNFIAQNFHQYIYYKNIKTKDGHYQLDAIVVGSDQVWRKWGKLWDVKYYFMNFADGWEIKKISYAASFGLNTWEFNEQDTQNIKHWLNQYSSVSVRENDAVALCKENLRINAEWNIDPTMLLGVADYNKLLTNTKTESYPIITYILDPAKDKLEIRDAVCKKKGENPKSVNIQEGVSSTGVIKVQSSIESWLSNMMNADFIITDSFHGTAFAINFNRPFVVLSNQLRGQSRLLSILSMFGLEERLVNNVEEAEFIAEMPIDWERVNIILDAQRNKSKLYFEVNEL